MSCMYALWDVVGMCLPMLYFPPLIVLVTFLDDTIARKTNSSDAAAFARICGCFPSRGLWFGYIQCSFLIWLQFSVGSHMAHSSDDLLCVGHHSRASSVQSRYSRYSSSVNLAYMCIAIGCGAEDTIIALPSSSRLGSIIDIPQYFRGDAYHLRIRSIRSPVNTSFISCTYLTF
jgi:hypothetical protein